MRLVFQNYGTAAMEKESSQHTLLLASSEEKYICRTCILQRGEGEVEELKKAK